MLVSMMAPLLAAAAQAPAAPPPQPSVMTLAQALDTCMATYAVRLSRTDATDEAVFAGAQQGCGPLNQRLRAAVSAELPADQARELLATLETSERPNFMTMLQRIRADRRRRAGE